MIMGGGNGQKSMMALQKHMEKQKTVKGSQLESNKKAMSIQWMSSSYVRSND
ncbi:hypothetical protein SLEP1_g55885 [Rubroshorea leprosula]|uniref:Uncharacterized protein n=1 Tax=Rubroshorea leprosula TaxID=152421 RepID=A0AAV5MJC2_9ROSI|nr:hypothetical protein SLEP1_g55885 [Rubroshorea leprosula]